jgi:hypothetical protein
MTTDAQSLAKVILYASILHENSWNGKYYEITRNSASIKACKRGGIDIGLATPISLLLYICWNDILSWAESQKEV